MRSAQRRILQRARVVLGRRRTQAGRGASAVGERSRHADGAVEPSYHAPLNGRSDLPLALKVADRPSLLVLRSNVGPVQDEHLEYLVALEARREQRRRAEVLPAHVHLRARCEQHTHDGCVTAVAGLQQSGVASLTEKKQRQR